MEERNFFERLVDVSPGMEIWWDSSPVIFENWCKKLLEKADPADRDLLQTQFDRMYNKENPQNQLFRGVTTNPPLSLQAIQNDPAYWEKVAKGILAENPGLDKEGLFWELYKTVVKVGSDMYLPLFEASGYKEGFLSGQVDPRSAFDKDAMIRQAEEIAAVNPNVMVKVPGTKQGYEVIEYLTAKGISTNNTLTFVLPQLVDCANTVKRGLETAKKNGVDLSKWRSVINCSSSDACLWGRRQPAAIAIFWPSMGSMAKRSPWATPASLDFATHPPCSTPGACGCSSGMGVPTLWKRRRTVRCSTSRRWGWRPKSRHSKCCAPFPSMSTLLGERSQTPRARR